MSNNQLNKNTEADVVLIGAGIMSATLGAMLKELQPDLTIEMFERLDTMAAESSDAMNNAGTGHSAFCELNYTPELSDGTVDISKAIKIAEQFETTKEFWSFLVEQKLLPEPKSFITPVPHMSFVWGDDNVAYLKKRYEALAKHHLFAGMQYSEHTDQLMQWIPLVMEGRDKSLKVSATKMDLGTDVNFGALTNSLFDYMQKQSGVNLHLQHDVTNVKRNKDQSWKVSVKNLKSGSSRTLNAKFVFIGAGGGALHLLQKSGIPESKGFGGFPVSGQWLVCHNESVIERHQAKVYGKASVGSPPMSVPHLDTRMINGKKALLFGPYAGFSTRFLKQGSLWDLFGSIKLSNIAPMMKAGIDNIPLTRYLVSQVTQSQDDRMEALREYFPHARPEDWSLDIAGQRVQVIKKDPKKGGVLEFGTEVVTAADGSIAALLGASPGASTSVSIMIQLIERCFKDKAQSPEWQAKFKRMIPSYGQSLAKNVQLANEARERTSKILQLVK
ncbi:malate:quinone oxidoreductase [Mucilaginibacter robiniae]|uniref:Probable malate:quinone oxidoreductase n=1 Tax=Mucilaginibacter robiniae TaxID=2728022 RepID=A0A7L5E3I3_9SPHI|nr:malate:quinone oxidoreductase [Mucilaginibacter robiniae]QJD94896.1 malate:quinone oxidoreductase [Mucilaginibacter robiniae]